MDGHTADCKLFTIVPYPERKRIGLAFIDVGKGPIRFSVRAPSKIRNGALVRPRY